MSKKTISLLLFASVFCALLLTSCSEDEECRLPRFVVLNTGFYRINTNPIGETSTARLVVDSLEVRWANVRAYVRRTDRIFLSLNKLSELSEFVFELFDAEQNFLGRDTVSIFHEVHEEFLSFECGFLHTFTIDETRTRTTNHFIDSIVINSKEVNNFSNAEHIRLYHTR